MGLGLERSVLLENRLNPSPKLVVDLPDGSKGPILLTRPSHLLCVLMCCR